MKTVFSAAVAILASSHLLSAADAAKGWSFADGQGYRDVLLDGKTVLRHMNAWDPARRDETFKPYTHVFDFAGKEPITKGPGGDFTHHRGIFIGWNKTVLDGKSYDFWHCKNVIRQHDKYLKDQEKADANGATMVSVTNWPAPDGKIVVRETQTITATKQAEGKLQLDLTFKLEAPSGPVKLEGDLQHAGVHFRAAQEVHKREADMGKWKKANPGKQPDPAEAKKLSSYILPAGIVKLKGDILEQCNWVVCQFNIGDTRYAVAHFNDPKNAQPVQYSTRAYGRFGAFSKTAIPADEPLTLRYRIIVADTAKVPAGTAEDWQKQFDAFASGK